MVEPLYQLPVCPILYDIDKLQMSIEFRNKFTPDSPLIAYIDFSELTFIIVEYTEFRRRQLRIKTVEVPAMLD